MMNFQNLSRPTPIIFGLMRLAFLVLGFGVFNLHHTFITADVCSDRNHTFEDETLNLYSSRNQLSFDTIQAKEFYVDGKKIPYVDFDAGPR